MDAPESIAQSFNRYFSVQLVDSGEMLAQVQRIRYSVYCEEFGYENPHQFPDGREVDQYDSYLTRTGHPPSHLNAGRLRAYGSNVDGRDASAAAVREVLWRAWISTTSIP